MSFKIVDLVVIGDIHCTTTKTYLEYMYRNGFKPKSILLCNFLYRSPPASNKHRLIHLLNKKLYKKFPYDKPIKYTPLAEELHILFQKHFDYKIDFSHQNQNFSRYSENIKQSNVWDYNDPELQSFLLRDTSTHYLYTNGGIVPKSLFDKGIKILHVHPGIVPYVKGSDGLFWSLLSRSKLGYSCFYMNSGIDTGSLIYQEEFEPIKFPEIKNLIEHSWHEIYGALLRAYDPHYRAIVFSTALKNIQGDLLSIKSINQEDKGKDFYAMHSRLIKKVLDESFC